MGDYDQELVVSPKELCEYLTIAETKIQQAESLGKHFIARGIKKRRRSETPLEEIVSGDEIRYMELEDRAVKRTADNDPDYEDTSSVKSSSQ